MTLRENFEKHSQGHVFAFWDELDAAQKVALTAQLEQIDLDELDALIQTLVKNADAGAKPDFSGLEPAPYVTLPEFRADDPLWADMRKIGEDAIRAGRLAAFVVAGGQGTRLGFDAPKGCYPVSPVRHKSLFQIFAEKILNANAKYGANIPWLVMTSNINDAPTRKFFEDNSYFGLRKEDVIFFSQGLMPAVNHDGKIILESKSKIAMTPDGHGGCLRGMCRSGAVAELKKRGIDCLTYWQVDNPLVNTIDPYFLGFHINAKSQMSSKMIPKAYPLEKVGHFCLENGKLCVVEYSDLPNEYQEMTDADGKLKFIAGSVAIHILDRDFIEKLGGDSDEAGLPFHRADKKIPCVDLEGNAVKPEKPNGIKFEMFVFDALPLAKNPIIIEGARAYEFSPVKNAEGVDSPATCKADQKKQFARWFKRAGIILEKNADGTPVLDIEVSPKFAIDSREFADKWALLNPKPEIKNGLYIE